ncbi:hypothetical protein [Phenylobacterium montanum]|uniref:Metal-dependent hydrolase n=1 Tax=Phenylobacterium montanum TaxID=2823693 RepID=A0A975FWC3_9CAUL|nr:hypothetical protein [Caulobacter sp. S6]QUD86152.1 hypothetical protein KCG34_13690 [Caulobacter sp. S6]
MFVGHYAAALAAKSAEPRPRLWTYVAACQLMDIGWSSLIMAGVEKMRIDPHLPGSALDLYFMPYTHSLPGSLLWSLGAAVLARLALRLPWRAAAFVGATVFSHWVLDLVVHRPDLALWFGGPKVGLGFWNYPLAEMALELGLVGMAGGALIALRKQGGDKAWPIIAFMGFLTVLQMVSSLSPMSGDPVSSGGMALAAYLVTTGVAWLAERPKAG